jgi:hypothetical protein
MFEKMIDQPTQPQCEIVSSERTLGKADHSKIVVQRNIFANLPLEFASLFISRSFSLTLNRDECALAPRSPLALREAILRRAHGE